MEAMVQSEGHKIEEWQRAVLVRHYEKRLWPHPDTIRYLGLSDDEVLVSPKSVIPLGRSRH